MSDEPRKKMDAYILNPMKVALHGIEDKGG